MPRLSLEGDIKENSEVKLSIVTCVECVEEQISSQMCARGGQLVKLHSSPLLCVQVKLSSTCC